MREYPPPPGPGDMSLISATNQERRYEQLLHNCSRVTFLICCFIISFDHQKDHVNRLNMGFLSVPKAYFTTRISPNIDRFKVYFEQKWKDREEFSNFLIKIMDSLLCKKIQNGDFLKTISFFTITVRIFARWLVESYGPWEKRPWKWRDMSRIAGCFVLVFRKKK